MAYTYLFFHPSRLPLTAQELSAETVLPLQDFASVREALAKALPDIEWMGNKQGRIGAEGKWMEFLLSPDVETLSLRCSLRADYRPIVQRLCDELGWLAFDQEPLCYQPHQAPMPC